MKPPNELALPEDFPSAAIVFKGSEKTAPASEVSPAPPAALTLSKSALAQIVLIVLGVVAALYFAQSVLLPIFARLAVWSAGI